MNNNVKSENPQTNPIVLASSSQPITYYHAVNGHVIGFIPPNMEVACFAMGCFWGVERLFWRQAGVYSTAAGYTGGTKLNPNYREVCTGKTGHAEAVQLIFDPAIISYSALLSLFWQHHDPAQGMRQGADIGAQYRSAIYTYSDIQQQQAEMSRLRYQQAMQDAGDLRTITTEIMPASPFYYAEEEHQQYLYKIPHGYCGLKGTGICFPE